MIFLIAMQRKDGGVVRGTMNQTKVDSEPHFDAFALFSALEKRTGGKAKAKWKKARKAAQAWGKKNVVQANYVFQGVSDTKGPNKEFAVDGQTWTFIGPYGDAQSGATLERYANTVLQKALVEVTFPLTDKKTITTTRLVDFTDPTSRESKRLRDGVHAQGTPEWTGGHILFEQKTAVAYYREGNMKKAAFRKAIAEILEDNAAKIIYRLPGHEGLFTIYSSGQWIQTGPFDERPDGTKGGWNTPYRLFVDDSGRTHLGASQIGAWWILPALGVNLLNPGDNYFVDYQKIKVRNADKKAAQAYINKLVGKPGKSYTEATIPEGIKMNAVLPEPGNYNGKMWDAFNAGDWDTVIEWANKVVEEKEWIRLAAEGQKQKAKEVGGMIQYRWDTTYPKNDHPLHHAIWNYPLLNEVAVAYFALAAANFEKGNISETRKWMDKGPLTMYLIIKLQMVIGG